MRSSAFETIETTGWAGSWEVGYEDVEEGWGQHCTLRHAIGEHPGFGFCSTPKKLRLASPEMKFASHFLRFGGTSDCRILAGYSDRKLWYSVMMHSFAEISMVATSDLVAGFRWLKPSSTDCEREHNSVVVECCGWNPCWVVASLMRGEILLRTRRSRTLAVLHNRDMDGRRRQR